MLVRSLFLSVVFMLILVNCARESDVMTSSYLTHTKVPATDISIPILTTNKSIQDVLIPEISSYELLKIVNKQFLNWKQEFSNTVFIGHNSIEFDENLLEYSLFTNLFK